MTRYVLIIVHIMGYSILENETVNYRDLEEKMMKKGMRHSYSSHYCPAYPNEADTNYYKQKLLEVITGLLSGCGLTISIVLLTMIT